MRVEAQVPLKGLAERTVFGRTRAEQRVGQRRQERHPGRHVVAHTVPLDHREFRVVQRPQFIAAKRPRDLKDRLRAGRQQTLHPELGRRLQVIATLRRGPRRTFHRDRVQVTVDHRIGRQQRRFDFPKAMLVEKITQPPQQFGSPLQ